MTVQFVIGTQGLNTSIDEFYYEDEFWTTELPPNTAWEHVTVADENAMNEWIAAKNTWLNAAWTPNQDSDERQENAGIMRQAEERMTALEIK